MRQGSQAPKEVSFEIPERELAEIKYWSSFRGGGGWVGCESNNLQN